MPRNWGWACENSCLTWRPATSLLSVPLPNVPDNGLVVGHPGALSEPPTHGSRWSVRTVRWQIERPRHSRSYTSVLQKKLVHHWGAHSRASSLSLWSARNPHEMRVIGLLVPKTLVLIGTEKWGGSSSGEHTFWLVQFLGLIRAMRGHYCFASARSEECASSEGG